MIPPSQGHSHDLPEAWTSQPENDQADPSYRPRHSKYLLTFPSEVQRAFSPTSNSQAPHGSRNLWSQSEGRAQPRSQSAVVLSPNIVLAYCWNCVCPRCSCREGLWRTKEAKRWWLRSWRRVSPCRDLPAGCPRSASSAPRVSRRRRWDLRMPSG